MTVQNSTLTRNAMLDAITTAWGASIHIELWSGAVEANCAAASSGTKLAKFDLAASYDDVAAAGVKNIVKAASLPLATTGLAANTIGHYRVFKSDDTTCVEQGTVTVTGGGGDMTVDNLTVAVGQAVQITGFTKTAPGA